MAQSSLCCNLLEVLSFTGREAGATSGRTFSRDVIHFSDESFLLKMRVRRKVPLNTESDDEAELVQTDHFFSNGIKKIYMRKLKKKCIKIIFSHLRFFCEFFIVENC